MSESEKDTFKSYTKDLDNEIKSDLGFLFIYSPEYRKIFFGNYDSKKRLKKVERIGRLARRLHEAYTLSRSNKDSVDNDLSFDEFIEKIFGVSFHSEEFRSLSLEEIDEIFEGVVLDSKVTNTSNSIFSYFDSRNIRPNFLVDLKNLLDPKAEGYTDFWGRIDNLADFNAGISKAFVDTVLGQFKHDKTARKLLFRFFSKADLRVLLHENLHLLRSALGSSSDLLKFRQKFLGNPFAEINDPWTVAEEELFVEKMMFFLSAKKVQKNMKRNYWTRIRDYLFTNFSIFESLKSDERFGIEFAEKYTSGYSSSLSVKSVKPDSNFTSFLWLKDKVTKGFISRDESVRSVDLAINPDRLKDLSTSPLVAFRKILGSSSIVDSFFNHGFKFYNSFVSIDPSILKTKKFKKYLGSRGKNKTVLVDLDRHWNKIVSLSRKQIALEDIDSISYSLYSSLTKGNLINASNHKILRLLNAENFGKFDEDYSGKDLDNLKKSDLTVAKTLIDEYGKDIFVEFLESAKVYNDYVSQARRYALESGVYIPLRSTDQEVLNSLGAKVNLDSGFLSNLEKFVDTVVQISNRNRLISNLVSPYGVSRLENPLRYETYSSTEYMLLPPNEREKLHVLFTTAKTGEKLEGKGVKEPFFSNTSFVRFDDPVEYLLQSLSRQDDFITLFFDGLGIPSSFARNLMVSNIVFIMNNVLKDIHTTLGNTRSGILNSLRNLPSSLKKMKTDWSGIYNSSATSDTTIMRDALGAGFIDLESGRQDYGDASKTFLTSFLAKNKNNRIIDLSVIDDLNSSGIFHNLYKFFKAGAVASESLNRNNEFVTAYEHFQKLHPELSENQLLLMAAEESIGLMDYSRMGYVIQHLNKAFMFLGSGIRGSLRLFEGFSSAEGSKVTVDSFLKKLAPYATFIALGILVPRVIARFLNGDEFEDEVPDYYSDFGVTLNMERITNGYIKGSWFYPQGYEHALIGSFISRSYSHLKGDKHAFENFGSNVFQSVIPVDSSFSNVVPPVSTLLQLYDNKNYYFDSPIYRPEKRRKTSIFADSVEFLTSIKAEYVDFSIANSLYYYGDQFLGFSTPLAPHESVMTRILSRFTGFVKTTSPYQYNSVRRVLNSKDDFNKSILFSMLYDWSRMERGSDEEYQARLQILKYAKNVDK